MLILWAVCSILNLILVVKAALDIPADNRNFPGFAFLCFWFVVLAPCVSFVVLLDRALYLKEYYYDR